MKQQHALFQQNSGNTLTNTAPTTHQVYRIQSEDLIQIRNLQGVKFLDGTATNVNGGTSSIGETFQVEEDGRITLPALGHIPIAGLTRYQAAQKIEKLYRDSLLNNPIIELKVLNLKVTIFGEAKGTGNYALKKDNTTLIDVLGEAGGLTNNADEKHIKIIRGEKDKRSEILVDLSDVKVLDDPRIVLQNNDIIYIAQNKRAIRDDKIQNFSSLVQPSLLIFNTALIIYTLFR